MLLNELHLRFNYLSNDTMIDKVVVTIDNMRDQSKMAADGSGAINFYHLKRW